MKNKLIYTFLFLSINFFSISQETVSLIVSGQAKTKEDAKLNAFRNAIEEAFGTFISSKTEILNDEIIRDEIISFSNGNILDYKIISEIQMPNNEWQNTMSATVSIIKLTSFCESRNINVEFKGDLFAANIKLYEFAKANEKKVIENLFETCSKLINSKGLFDFSISADEPKAISIKGVTEYQVPIKVFANMNSNIYTILDITKSTLEELNLKQSELDFMKKSNLNRYSILLYSNNNNEDKKKKKKTEYEYNVKINVYNLRNHESIRLLGALFGVYIPSQSLAVSIDNGIEEIELYTIQNNFALRNDNQRNKIIKTKFNFPNNLGTFINCNYYLDTPLTTTLFYNRTKGYEQFGIGNYITPSPELFRVNLINDKNDNFFMIDYLNTKPWYLNFYFKNGDDFKLYGGIDMNDIARRDWIGLDFSAEPTKIQFVYSISDTRSLDEISKISNYKVSPILDIIWE